MNIDPKSDSEPELSTGAKSENKVFLNCSRRLHIRTNTLVLTQAENEHLTALHLTGMDVGSNGHNAFG